LIKSLNSVETLGSTTFIASDKTGTLTKNEMTVTRFFANGVDFEVEGHGYDPLGDITPKTEMDSARQFIIASILNNEANVSKNPNGKYVPFGNPTDVALVVLGLKSGLDRHDLLNQKAELDYDILKVFPFDSTRKMMSVVIKSGTEFKILTKGAPDVLLNKSATGTDQDLFEEKITEFAQDALRTLAVGERVITEEQALNAPMEELEQNITLLGLAGIIDPPREEVRQSVEKLHNADINVVMITGDHAKTAAAIATKLGIISDDNAQVMEGKQIDKLTDDE